MRWRRKKNFPGAFGSLPPKVQSPCNALHLLFAFNAVGDAPAGGIIRCFNRVSVGSFL